MGGTESASARAVDDDHISRRGTTPVEHIARVNPEVTGSDPAGAFR